MKSKDEFRRTVMEKAERYEAERKARGKKIRESVLLCSICIAVSLTIYLSSALNNSLKSGDALPENVETTASDHAAMETPPSDNTEEPMFTDDDPSENTAVYHTTLTEKSPTVEPHKLRQRTAPENKTPSFWIFPSQAAASCQRLPPMKRRRSIPSRSWKHILPSSTIGMKYRKLPSAASSPPIRRNILKITASSPSKYRIPSTVSLEAQNIRNTEGCRSPCNRPASPILCPGSKCIIISSPQKRKITASLKSTRSLNNPISFPLAV